MTESGRSRRIEPISRGIATLLVLLGVFLCQRPVWLLILWAITFVVLGTNVRTRRVHVRFLAVVWLPVTIALFFVWGMVVGAAPGQPLHSSSANGLRFAAITATRILALGSIVHVSLLSLETRELIAMLRAWRVSDDGIVAALGAISLLPEMQLRASQVLAARMARGLVANNWRSRMMALPALLPTLFAWVLRAALQRGEAWEHRNLVTRLSSSRAAVRRVSAAGYLAVAAGCLWFALSALDRFLGLP